MNPELPRDPREELEARLTALLLGELSADEAAEVRAAIVKDPELARLHARLEQTLGLVREVAASPSEPATAQAEPLRLSEERRDKLLAHFKTIAPPEFAKEKKRVRFPIVEWAAAFAILIVIAGMAIPNFVKSRNTSLSNVVINNLRQIDAAKQQWALERGKSDSDIPTSEDLKPYIKGGLPRSVAGESYSLGRVGDDVVVVADEKTRRKLGGVPALNGLQREGRESGATTSATEATTARMAADAGLERAKAELMDRILDTRDVQNSGSLVGSNYFNWAGSGSESKAGNSGVPTEKTDELALVRKLSSLNDSEASYNRYAHVRNFEQIGDNSKGDGAQNVNLHYEPLAPTKRTEIALPFTDQTAQSGISGANTLSTEVSTRGFFDDSLSTDANVNWTEAREEKRMTVVSAGKPESSSAPPEARGGPSNVYSLGVVGYVNKEFTPVSNDKSGVAAGVTGSAFSDRLRNVVQPAEPTPLDAEKSANYAVTASTSTRAKIVLPPTEPAARAEVALGTTLQTGKSEAWSFDADTDGGRSYKWGNNPPAPQKPAIEFSTAAGEERGRGLGVPEANRGENRFVSRYTMEIDGSARELERLHEKGPVQFSYGTYDPTKTPPEVVAGGRIGGARGAEVANPVPATPPATDPNTGLPLPIPSLSTADDAAKLYAGDPEWRGILPGQPSAPTSAGQPGGAGGGGGGVQGGSAFADATRRSPEVLRDALHQEVEKAAKAPATEANQEQFFTGLTKDDVGGLRYLYRTGSPIPTTSDGPAPAVPPPSGRATIIAAVPGAAEVPPTPVIVPEPSAIAGVPIDTLQGTEMRRRYSESGTKPVSQPKLSPNRPTEKKSSASTGSLAPLDTKGGAGPILGGYAGGPSSGSQPLTTEPVTVTTVGGIAATSQNNFGAIAAGGTTPDSSRFGDATTTLNYEGMTTNYVVAADSFGVEPAAGEHFYRLKLNEDGNKAEVAGKAIGGGQFNQLADENGKAAKAPVLGDMPTVGRVFRSELQQQAKQTAEQPQKSRILITPTAAPADIQALREALDRANKEGTKAVESLNRALAEKGIAMINVGDDFVKAVPTTQAGNAGAAIRKDSDDPYGFGATLRTALKDFDDSSTQKADVASLNKQISESQKQVEELGQNLKISDYDAKTSSSSSLNADEVRRLQKEAATSGEARRKLEEAKKTDFAEAEKARPYYDAKAKLEDLENFRKIINMRRSAETIDVPRSGLVEIIDRAEPAKEKNAGIFAKLGSYFSTDYESKARVKVERDTPDIPGMSGKSSIGTYDPYFIETEQEAIRSEAVLGKVVEKLALDKEWAKKSGGKNLKKSEAIAELRKKLDIEPVKNTSLLEINAKSGDPKEAAAIANAVAEVYKEHHLEKGQALVRGGIEALNEQFTAQDEKIKAARSEVERLRKELNISDPDAPSPQMQLYLDAKDKLEDSRKILKLMEMKRDADGVSSNQMSAGVRQLFDAQEEKIRVAQVQVDRLAKELNTSGATTKPVPSPVDVEPPPVRKVSTNSPIQQPEVQTSENAFSTFSLNVSDVSFKLAAASLEKGQMPDVASIRSEEFINAFDYRDPEAAPGTAITFAWERARYPFAHNRDLLRFSLKTAAVGRQAGRPLNIVLLLDNSGSMERSDRVAIIREALHVLAKQLQPQDLFSVITFARTPRLWMDGFSGDKAGEVADQLSDLAPAGGTNLEEAMKLAYQTASRHYFVNGINRVVVLTDGAANLGNVDPESLKQMVESQRKQGIALDCFGIGWEGFNDDLLEVLSRNGDGRYGFLNSPEEAASEFAGQLAGALQVAASDVKVQVEFNPRRATTYRQIGYAKHQLTKQQFRDNTVDAAEIASQEAGNALYTAEVNLAGEGPICTVRVRYKIPGTTDYREQEWDVPFTGNSVSLENASPAMRLAATASAFSEWLAASPFAGEVSPNQLLNYLSGVPEIYGADGRPKKLEWMIRQAKSIEGK